MFFLTAVVCVSLCALAKGGFQTNQAWFDEWLDSLTNWFQKGGVNDWPTHFDDNAKSCFNSDLEGCAVGIEGVAEAYEGLKDIAEFAWLGYEDVVFGEGYFGLRWVTVLLNGDCKEFIYGRTHHLINDFGQFTFDLPIPDDIDEFNDALARVTAPECINNGNGNGNSGSESSSSSD